MALTNKLVALGDAIREKAELTEKMTIEQMTTAVQGLEVNPAPNVEEITIIENGTYIPDEGVDGFNKVIVNVPVDFGDLPEDLLHLTGDQRYKFRGNAWNSFINKYGNQITTENITAIQNMFIDNTQLQDIPFALNMSKTAICSLSYAFQNASNLKHLPIISNCKVDTSGIQNMCNNCYKLKEINIDNYDMIKL